MTQLTITSAPGMGPLEVSVYPPDGDPVEFTLSSGSQAKSLSALPGRYTIIARRPNGSRLRQTTVVAGGDASVSLSETVGAPSDKFMQRETERGDVARPATIPARSSLGEPLSGVSADLLARAALRSTAWLALRGGHLAGDPAAPVEETAVRRPLVLRGWRFDGSQWLALGTPEFMASEPVLSGDFLKLAMRQRPDDDAGPGAVLCLGLLDETGFGPLVIVPPLMAAGELTFVAKGVLTRASDRDATPGQQRVPVALFTPGAAAVADILSALAGPGTLSAETLWNQTAPNLLPGDGIDVANVLELLVDKFRRPAEALVAAHYLLRFLPNQLPLRWAENLVRAMPSAADGPVIAAWAWIYNRPPDATDKQVDESVTRNVLLALNRPATLFARTRALLFEALHLVPADLQSEALLRTQETFRRAGAAAGGVESFWGKSPDSPGCSGEPRPGPDLLRVVLEGDAFVPARQRGGPPPSQAVG